MSTNTTQARLKRRRSAERRKDSADAVPPVGTEAAQDRDVENGPTAPSAGGAEAEHALEHALEALSVDRASAERIQKLPHDVGWLLVTAGVVGVVMPGVLGVPFLVLGGLILLPGTNRRAERWLTGHSPKIFKGSIRQINRFLDDLERRYPRSPKK